jgi:hypothetical protein
VSIYRTVTRPGSVEQSYRLKNGRSLSSLAKVLEEMAGGDPNHKPMDVVQVLRDTLLGDTK